MNATLLDAIQSLERRAERLEKEAAALRHDLTRMAHDLENPNVIAATYLVDGKPVFVTQEEVDAVRSRMNRTRKEAVLHEIALAYKVASQEIADGPEAESKFILETVEAVRAAAILDGSALEDEREALPDD